MFHGNTDIQHNDIHKEAEKGAGKNKEMGKMTHKGATESVRKGEMRKGDHTALQLGADQGEQINTGSVEDAIENSKL